MAFLEADGKEINALTRSDALPPPDVVARTARLVTLSAHHDLEVPLTVGAERNQEYRFELTRLPGRISFEATPEPASVSVDGTDLGTTPLIDLDIPAGLHQVVFSHPRYQPFEVELDVEGRRVAQRLDATLGDPRKGIQPARSV